MKWFFLVLTAGLTAALCYLLSTTALLPAPLGSLLSPQEGIWQNAEATHYDYSADLKFSGLKGKVEVYLDDRLVPHVFAEQEPDVYFVQGYLHARFRLWQMELQTMFAAGRVSEIVGKVALDHDREFRRLGMVYAAENSLKEMEKDAATIEACDAYTAGVNAFIGTLNRANLPLEYKLLGYVPEKWSNLKSALFLKYMAYDLCAHENDFGMTEARNFFSKEQFDLLFPAIQDSLDPIIPKGTLFLPPSVGINQPINADSLYLAHKQDSIGIEEVNQPNPANGSNNWAISGSKSASGAPILCNDPHLGLNLPSVWYEIQLSTPNFNAYGVSFPGAPGVIIGYNDYCAFGFTNGGRDVRDYYEIQFQDDQQLAYWFDSSWVKPDKRVEQIRVKGQADFYDTVSYTIFGPVIYDPSFYGKNKNGNGKSYAVKWAAHNSSNEFKLFYELNRARNYSDYLKASHYLFAPGQNIVFACKDGDIAMRTQGKFPAKWKGQGDYVMPGIDSNYLWQGYIPEYEIPYQYNPERGFVSSANQRPVDSTYPYYLGREYPMYRGIIINRKLFQMQLAGIKDMMDLQNCNYSVEAEYTIPVILKNIDSSALSSIELEKLKMLSGWNFQYEATSAAPVLFEHVWKELYSAVYDDEYTKVPIHTQHPYSSTLTEAMLRDSNYLFFDNITTPQKETLRQCVTQAFQKGLQSWLAAQKDGNHLWGRLQDTHIDHLLKLPSFSRLHLDLNGAANAPNAITSNHGPSWRMIVHLTKNTEALGIYPGGQQGNPGSQYYDDGIEKWSKGEYHNLWLMTKKEAFDKRIKWKLSFSSPI